MLGLIATRSFHEPVYGILDLVDEARDRVKSGILAYTALSALQIDPNDKHAEEILDAKSRKYWLWLIAEEIYR